MPLTARRSIGTMFRASLFVAVSLTMGCGTKYVSTKSPDAHLLANQAAPDVRAAIIRALADGHHSAESETAGRIVARLGKPSRYARVAIEYSDTQYVVRYLDGNLKTKTGLGDEVFVDKRFKSMTDDFEEYIESELQRPARELAQAEQNRRDYHLMLQQSRTAQAQADAEAARIASQPPAEAYDNAQSALAPAPQVVVPVPAVQYSKSVRRSEQSLTCCINGALYKCPSEDAFQACLGSGPSQCTRAGRCK